jgi:hypothetical protein
MIPVHEVRYPRATHRDNRMEALRRGALKL